MTAFWDNTCTQYTLNSGCSQELFIDYYCHVNASWDNALTDTLHSKQWLHTMGKVVGSQYHGKYMALILPPHIPPVQLLHVHT